MTALAFPITRGAAEERYSSPTYHYDNAARGDIGAFVIQLTLAGCAFITGPEGTTLVPQERAMLFSHEEPTDYGYPPEASDVYRLRYVTFSQAPEIDVMFQRLRQRFGRVVRLPDKSPARALFDVVFAKSADRTFADRFEEAELVYRFLVALYREQISDTQTTDPIAYGHHLLTDRFRIPLNLKEVADACGVSREHFNRAFHARYGETPGRLLRRLRLDHARTMLRSTTLAVEDIAVASGFSNSNSFCRAYRQAFAVSPGRERAAT